MEIKLKKLIIGASAAIVFSTAAMAQQTIYTAPNGHITGYANQMPGGQTVYTAPNGHIIGYGNQTGNTTTYTAPNGHITGRATSPTFPSDE